jgi:hypothetical protein
LLSVIALEFSRRRTLLGFRELFALGGWLPGGIKVYVDPLGHQAPFFAEKRT